MNAKSSQIRTGAPVGTSRGRKARTASARGRARLEMAAVIALGVLLVVAACAAPADDSVDATRAHRVESGDTLWSLAEETRAPDQTIEQAIETIAEINRVEGGLLVVGSTIEVPADADLSTAQAMR